MSQRIILGVNTSHDTAFCLLNQHGEPILVLEEERFNRIRHTDFRSILALEYALATAIIDPASVEVIVYSFEMDTELTQALLGRCYDNVVQCFGRDIFEELEPFFARPIDYFAPLYGTGLLTSFQDLQTRLAALFPKARQVSYNHHLCHAASAFYPSPFETAAVLVVDGAGRLETTTIWEASEGELRLVERIDLPHSLGLLYWLFSNYLCLEEGQLMGLAAYGSPSFADLIYKQILSVDERGLFQLQSPLLFWFDMESDYALAKLEALLQHPARRKDEQLTQFHADVAASIQAVTEEVLVRLARYATAVTGRTKLCLAGGVIQNCVANGRIIAAGVCEELWIQPLANDSGTAVGAALWHYHGIEAGHAAGRWKMTTAQLGIGYADEDVASLLERVDLPYGESEHVASHAAEWLGQGHIVGWFQGRAEVGPRALGGRSLLADPARPFSAYRMNAVKGRQGWRPLAPSLLAERAASYFVGAVPSPYMIVSLPLRPEVRASLPAVSHVDGSARLQTVSPEPASPYRLLIEAFERRSGVPVVLNTSFNLRGEPIVQHPLDAIRTFLLTGVERLVIGRFLVEEKPDLPSGLRRALHASLYPSLYLHYLGSARRVAILAHPALTPAQRLRGEHLRILLQWLKIPCDSLSPAALPSWLETSPADGATLLSVAPHLDHTLLSGLHQRRNVALSVLVVDQRMFAVRQGVEAFLTTVERNYQRLRELVLHQELLVVCSTASEVSEIASIAAHLSLRVAGYYCWRDEQGLEDHQTPRVGREEALQLAAHRVLVLSEDAYHGLDRRSREQLISNATCWLVWLL